MARSGETPLAALRRGGIEYIEVRCIDVNPFLPVGLDAEQVRFMDTFLLFCLLQDSPDCADSEQSIQAANLEAVVNRGREPGLLLQTDSGEQRLCDWAGELFELMAPIAAMLDEVHQLQSYSAAMTAEWAKIQDPELTPSARVLREMREEDQPFFRIAMGYSTTWAAQFRTEELPADVEERLTQEAARSLQAQKDIEAADNISFEQYLAEFYAQYEDVVLP